MPNYTEDIADKIIEYWEDKVIGKKLQFDGQEVIIESLYKDPAREKFKVRVYPFTPFSFKRTPYTDELTDVIDELMLFNESSGFDWETGEEKKSESKIFHPW